MRKINNENGIKMFYEIWNEPMRVAIYDSDKKYFNDLLIEISYAEQDTKDIIKMLEQTNLQEMIDFFNAKTYATLNELARDNYLGSEETKDNDYINRFEINGKSKYTWSC